ncbi:MurR/RpiR family transcriptional regulator [Rhizobium leguminosarum bv. viciae]|nr:MurR/RpiR family transcriptional regulator [Rhizobium leguminosarum bv. viciae]
MNSEENLKRPNDLTELKAMIVKTGLTLPEQQERAARIALTNPELIAFGTVASVALKCSVSPSTVVRVATALGFASFRDFKTFFRQHLKTSRLAEQSINTARHAPPIPNR